MTTNRYRHPWTVNEVNKLWSEYDLQKLPVLQIAKNHQRGEYAILHRLAKEGLILESWADVRGWSYKPTDDKLVCDKPKSVTKVFFVDDDAESLEDNDDPNDSDYVYESDEDDEDDSVYQDSDNDSDSDYEDEDDADSVADSDSDYEDESEEYDPYSFKQKTRFLHNIISALKFFVYAV
jgi:hypothetical protein